jgi:hypothetical protein
MTKLLRLAVVVCLWICFQTHPAFACRYNVREIGFIDFGNEPYHIYGYVNGGTPADVVSSFREILSAELMNTNIRAEIIDTGQQEDHPAIEYLGLWDIKSFPAVILVSPDGQSLFVPVTKPGQPFSQTLRSALDDVVSSPKREEIIRQTIEFYGVVILIEAAQSQESEMARQAAFDAIKKISSQMKMMPKAIDRPPVLVVLQPELLSREKILLWSLGLDANEVNEPCAAVIFGKVRWIGPLMKGREITEPRLTGILSVIGADCECGLDREWMQGTMLPVKWDNKIQTLVAKTLKFDPENPMIKMEISQILKHGQVAGRSFRDLESIPDLPFGYPKLVVEFDSNSQTQEAYADVPNVPLPQAVVVEPASEPATLPEGESALQKSLYFIAGLAVLIIAAGLFITFRAARRNL